MTTDDPQLIAPKAVAGAVAVIDKPAGMTSHDVVDRVRRTLDMKRVGHAGTLDPDATGVLVLGLGRATRLLRYAQMGDKRYRAVAVFGATTSTQDSSGEVLERKPVRFSRADLANALVHFTGEIEQIPPMVSAVKVGGERLYKKARRGEEVERTARRVTISALDLIDFDDRAPAEARATLDVTCSGGTYIRTLVHDLGERLGSGAHLGALRRTASGPFTEDQAVSLADFGPTKVRPMTEAVSLLPSVSLDREQAVALANGRSVTVPGAEAKGDSVAALFEGQLVAVCKSEGNKLRPETVVA